MDAPPPSPHEIWTALREANRRGEFLEAFTIADHGVQLFGDDLELAYAAVLALARSGATKQAEHRYAAGRLWERAQEAPGSLRTDIMALRGRLQKDRAQRATGAERVAAL